MLTGKLAEHWEETLSLEWFLSSIAQLFGLKTSRILTKHYHGMTDAV